MFTIWSYEAVQAEDFIWKHLLQNGPVWPVVPSAKPMLVFKFWVDILGLPKRLPDHFHSVLVLRNIPDYCSKTMYTELWIAPAVSAGTASQQPRMDFISNEVIGNRRTAQTSSLKKPQRLTRFSFKPALVSSSSQRHSQAISKYANNTGCSLHLWASCSRWKLNPVCLKLRK